METLDVENNNNINNSDGGLSTPSNVLNNIENVSNHDGEEENLMVENDDEYAGIENLSQEELIDIIKEIREEYFNLKDKHRGLKTSLQESQKEVQFQRNLCAEREDLLLQLQWDPSQDKSYIHDEDEIKQQRNQALLDQMRIMEKGIFDRDDKITSLQKTIENLIVNQINAGSLPSDFQPSNTNIELNAINNNSQASSSNQSTPLNQSPSNAIPPVTKKISEYPLNYKQQDVVELYTPDYQLPAGKAPTRSPSFWQSPTGFLSYWVGWDTPMEEIADNSNDDTASSSSSAPKPKPPQSYPITKTFEEKAPIKTFSPSSSQPNPVLILPASKK